jgi:hypothetical protein
LVASTAFSCKKFSFIICVYINIGSQDYKMSVRNY